MIDFIAGALKLIPFLMTAAWISGALFFYFTRERRGATVTAPPELSSYPMVSIFVPCHNEEQTISRTIETLGDLKYPNYEVIAIDDGSRDRTLTILNKLAATRPWMRVIAQEKNQGKAAALNEALKQSQGDYGICIDADSVLHPNAPHWLMHHLMSSKRVAAVTGNPRVKNRGSLIGKLQVGEFTAIIGLIKRFQQVIGKLFTLSGVIAGFKKEALVSIGGWDTDCITEDIAVSWKLQTRGWDLVYEPRALCDVLMPETVKGLWKQRLRWAQGGFETMTKHASVLIKPGQWRLKMLYCEYLFSLAWVFALWGIMIASFVSLALGGKFFAAAWFAPLHWGAFLAGALCLVQFVFGSAINGRYDSGSGRFVYWAMWFPFAYWMLNTLALSVAIPKVLFSRRKKFSTWESPDRGGVIYDISA